MIREQRTSKLTGFSVLPNDHGTSLGFAVSRTEIVGEVHEVVTETEMMLTFTVDNMADHDERDLWDGTLTTEGGEVEVDHRPMARSRCHEVRSRLLHRA